MWLFLTLLVVAIASIWLYLRHYYAYWERRGVPHERPVIIFGNLKGIGKTLQFRDINYRIYEKFKGLSPFTGVFYIVTKTALILDLNLAKNILVKDFSNFHDRGLYHNVRDDPLTGHLVNIEGAEWRALRNKLTPIFTSGKMRYMFPTIVKVSERLTDACADLATQNKDGIVEMKELCARYTTDVIGTCAFGLECNSLKDPKAKFRVMGRSIFEKPLHSQFMQTLIMLSPKLAAAFRLKFFSDEVNDFFTEAVRKTVEYRIKNNVKRNDFMDLLIEMMKKDQGAEMLSKVDRIDLSQGLTLEQMTAQAFVFYVAGFHTSSTTISFLLYELALNPHIQEKLRQQINEALNGRDENLSYDAMNKMSYLEQVLEETLRKYPVVPHLVRKTITDYKVHDGNYVIEAGTTVVIPLDAIQRDPDYFPSPEKFDPSRFEPGKVHNRHSMSYLPFGDGPRNCIGMRFGKMQVKVALITLLRHFKFTVASSTDVPMEFAKTDFLLTAKKGIYLHAERLNMIINK